MNLRDLPGIWVNTRPPVGLEATRAYSAPGPRSPKDWAGVEGEKNFTYQLRDSYVLF